MLGQDSNRGRPGWRPVSMGRRYHCAITTGKTGFAKRPKHLAKAVKRSAKPLPSSFHRGSRQRVSAEEVPAKSSLPSSFRRGARQNLCLVLLSSARQRKANGRYLQGNGDATSQVSLPSVFPDSRRQRLFLCQVLCDTTLSKDPSCGVQQQSLPSAQVKSRRQRPLLWGRATGFTKRSSWQRL